MYVYFLLTKKLNCLKQLTIPISRYFLIFSNI